MSDPVVETKGQHTPAPWHWEWHDASLQSLSGPNCFTQHVLSVKVCRFCQQHAREDAENRRSVCLGPKPADADLIAAAPDLLAALKRVAHSCPCGARGESLHTHPHVIGCEIEAAIAKAEGREP